MIYDEQLKLSSQLCFPIYAASRIVMKLYKPFLDPFGLTYTQYITLLALWEEDGISVKALGEKLFLDSGTLTPLLKKLESQGLLERVRNMADERSVVISLTDRGKALKSEVAEIPVKMASCVDISHHDAVELIRILNLILSGENQGMCIPEQQDQT
jgi:DNA-binding MarR family transcriptional regulator